MANSIRSSYLIGDPPRSVQPLSIERRPFVGSLQRRGRSASLRGPGELFNPEACETGGLGLTVSLGAVRWNTTETPVRERIELFEMNVSNCGDELRHGERGAERPPPVLEAKPLCSGGIRRGRSDSYLVDPASSHMLVSKIKPCMSKYKQTCTVKLRMAH